MMITVEEARAIFNANLFQPVSENVELASSYGRILAEPIHGERDAPPFDRVMMDGIAIRGADLNQFNEFTCIGQQFAGNAPKNWKPQAGDCVETATGAVLPENTDRILPYEWLEQQGNTFKLNKPIEEIQGAKDHIHRQGSDRKRGDLSIPIGTHISAPEIAVLASEGYTHPSVYRLPRAAVISTGDELVDITDSPETHQIRRSNVFMLQSMMSADGIQAEAFHLDDDENVIAQWLTAYQDEYDLMIFSGGVSMGKKDFLPRLFKSHGIKEYFHKVSQRPGKPLWFGSNQRLTVFGLPGNPVSSLVSYAVHVRFWLQESLGSKSHKTAMLAEELTFPPKLTRFLPVRIVSENGTNYATAVGEQGSGDFESLIGSHGVIELPLEDSEFPSGSTFQYYPFHV